MVTTFTLEFVTDRVMTSTFASPAKKMATDVARALAKARS